MSWLANSIRNKILAVIVLGVATLVAAALYGFGSARSGLATVAHVNDTLIAQAIQTQAVDSAFKEQVQQWMAVLVRGHDSAALERAWKQFQFREREVRRGGEKLRAAVTLPAARAKLAEFLAAHEAMGVKYREALESFKASGFDARAADLRLRGVELEVGEQLEELVKVMRDASDAAVAEARHQANRGLAASLIVIAIATLAALLGCALLIMRTVVRPIARAVHVVDRVAAGDLTVEVESTSGDETGRLLAGLKEMRDGLARAVSVIRIAADVVDQASRQIAEGHADLSSRTEEQAAALEEAAASMQQLATTVRRNTENARQASAHAAGASDTASRGGQVMGEVVGTMGDITRASRKIGEIVGLIDSIAFQTNILALNAAVEAARAGEQGRGFAVVATEVRALAQRSALASKDIRSLIQGSADQVGKGTSLVESAGATMHEIVASVGRVNEMMTAIASASQEQLTGIDQVTDTVAQMDRVVQQNAALVAESASAAENLATQAGQLVASVARFRLATDALGESADEDAPPPPDAGTVPARHGRLLLDAPA
jgi:methyl-accepting chemotaxis protein-1 (serine sensor receptor)